MLSTSRYLTARSALMLGVAFFGTAAAAPALAQPATETVVVTGSRIPDTNVTSASPLSVATADQIQMTNAFGVEDVLTKLTGPDFTGGISNASTNGAVGLSEVGLRNLGPSRTLVLIDGQRLVPIFSGFSSVPDLNSVPVSMVDRIEVLRDGASSIYGADAIGGVINIITKKDFEGFQIDGHGGVSQHGGGDLYSLTGTLGVNFDRGNITVSLMNEHLSPVSGGDRAWVQDPHLNQPGLEGGSTYRSQLNIMQDAASNTVWNGAETTVNDPALGSLPCLQYLPSAGRVKLNALCPSVHPNPTVAGGLARTQASFSTHYDVTDDITFVASGFFTRRDSEQRLRPEPLLGASIASTNPTSGQLVFGGFYVPTSWPGYSDPNGTASTGDCPNLVGVTYAPGAAPQCVQGYFTPNNFGPRDYKQVSDTYRFRVGLEGHVFSDYNWEAGYVQQRNDTVQRTYNSGNWYHLAQATGQLPCLDVPGGCSPNAAFGYATPTTPFNFFNGVNTLNQSQVDYLKTTLVDTNYSYENYIYADINGPLVELPAGTAMGAVGFERRFEYAADNPDALVQNGYAANPSAPTAGGYGVTSIYGELRVPLLKGLPGVESLTFTPSARWDHYSTFGDASTYKLGAEWQVIDDIRVRGSYNTGFRAPSTAELYGGHGISYITVSGDPCDSRGPGPIGALPYDSNANAGTGSLAPNSGCFTQLTGQGLSPAQIAAYQSPENNLDNDQRGLIVGGSSTLKPEQSHSWNIGVVLTPTFLPGFSFNADYYEVTITSAILVGGIAGNAGPDLVVNGCYVDQNPAYCGLLSRNASGIFQILSTNTNFGENGVTGLDLEAAYDTAAAGVDLPFGIPGSLTVDAQASHQITNYSTNPDNTINAFHGFFNYSNDSIQPKWKGNLLLDWTMDNIGIHYGLQYIGGTYDGPAIYPVGGGYNYASFKTGYGDQIPGYVYHDISVSYDFPEMGPVKGTRLVLGINNLFDKDPPFLTGDAIGKSNSILGPYDTTGRLFYTRFSIKL
jgi:iron complex outermembrane receptor protein